LYEVINAGSDSHARKFDNRKNQFLKFENQSLNETILTSLSSMLYGGSWSINSSNRCKRELKYKSVAKVAEYVQWLTFITTCHIY